VEEAARVRVTQGREQVAEEVARLRLREPPGRLGEQMLVGARSSEALEHLAGVGVGVGAGVGVRVRVRRCGLAEELARLWLVAHLVRVRVRVRG